MSYILDLVYPKVKLDTSLFKLSSPRLLPSFDSVLPLFHYHPPLSKYLHSYKYNYQFELSISFAKIASQTLHTYFPNILNYWKSNNFILIPVPLHWTRQNWRGFNQSNLFSRDLSGLLSLSFQNNWLFRPHYHSPQIKQNRQTRQHNLLSAFAINTLAIPSIKSSSGNFILVDDVITTGSTLSAAIQPLLPYTKNPPWALTIAG